MCGKFTAMMTWSEYVALAGVGIEDAGLTIDPAKELAAFTPMATVPILHLGPVRQRRITPMRWGWFDPRVADPLRSFKHAPSCPRGSNRHDAHMDGVVSGTAWRDLRQAIQHRRRTA
jgi:hypothetical protein